MALKKRKISKSEAEQLYMLEILVERVDVRPRKNVDDEEHGCLMVRVEFIDLTPVDIIAEEFIKAAGGERCKNKESRLLDEHAGQSGKSCLFTRAPSNLIRSIKSTPLSVEVYRIPRSLTEDRNSRDDARILLCAATAFLPGCFCNRVAEAKRKVDGLPEPYTLKRTYTLADERGVSCGSATIYLRLSCFGSSIIDHFALREKSFVLQGFPLGEKFRCATQPDKNASDEMSRIRYDDDDDDDDDTLPPNKILRTAYLKVCDQEDRTDASPVLTRPQSPPRVSINQPGFEKLTSAEKLNDRRYRGLVYAAYPDEPTCSCLPTNRSSHPLMCRSGCLRPCCMALRNPDVLRNNVPLPAMPTNRVSEPYLKSSAAEDDINSSDDPNRMRGGGDKANIRSKHIELLWNDEYTWHGDNINLKHRLMGGSEYASRACTPSEMVTTVLYEKSKETVAGTTCRVRPRSADGVMMGCTCPGKDPSFGRTGSVRCARKPCVGADCMIRAFKEAQDFVDSIGKVPGLAGLGLMDPSESPYFGRDVIGVQEMPRRVYPATVTTTSPNLQCTAPCNTQTAKITPIGAPAISYAPITAATFAVPGRGSVVREAIPTLPEVPLLPLAVKPKKKEDKKEEKTEKQKEADIAASASSDVDVGPCGEPRCKSRRKTPGNSRLLQLGNANNSQKATVQPKAPPSAVAVKSATGYPRERPKTKPSPGPGDDRDAGKMFPVKVSKRVMRYVYTIGEIYPGIAYGHKNCVDPRMRVPANMGWLWNTSDTVDKLKPRIGWRPGAIGRYLYELLKKAKLGSLEERDRLRSVPSRTTVRRGKAYKPMSYASAKQAKEDEEETKSQPALRVLRKDGIYDITMYPIKAETADGTPRLEEPTKPLRFKVAKSRNDASVASSSTASDMEIEFSPPAAVNRYRKKPDVVHVDTQVRQQEILDAFKLPETAKLKKEKKEKKEKEKEKKEKIQKKERR